ncbi:hypothetical protein LTR86_000920 [Recurvomyces mirabilis]|nr:hypothetical protein LTR86_000920 [Recurvomyces mirabilis]
MATNDSTSSGKRAWPSGSIPNSRRLMGSTSEAELNRTLAHLRHSLQQEVAKNREQTSHIERQRKAIEEQAKTIEEQAESIKIRAHEINRQADEICSLEERVYSAADEYRDIAEDIIDELKEKVDGLEDDLACEQQTVGRQRAEIEALTAELEQQKLRLEAVVEAGKEAVKVADGSSVLQLGHAMFKLKEVLEGGSWISSSDEKACLYARTRGEDSWAGIQILRELLFFMLDLPAAVFRDALWMRA